MVATALHVSDRHPSKSLYCPLHQANFSLANLRSSAFALMDIDENSRKLPNILITGTPGTGKSTHGQLLAEQSSVPLRHINVGDLVKEKGLHEGYDEEWQAYTVDEDKVSLLI